ncbi:PRC-barrel domain-containing protein [Oricola nitratireducens]|uniref:PRC-barrel domain-containing protein n=1 Tax=Oricola nitratireducens TaxID=2775868 RepID=UPI0018668ABC|nr:PRC-barrel domain-containing protein [Oricola nitratireducens]
MDTGNTVTGQAETGSDIFFVYEADNQYRSTKLVGHTVTDSQDETLGDINDLVVSADGKLEGVIIGVGGFLGIGEKNVGVRFSALTITENPEAGDMRVTLDTTRDQLESAPEFVTKEAQAAAERRQQDMQGIGGTDTGVTGALPPATPAVPGEEPPAAPAQ